MSKERVLSLLRHLLTLVASYFVAKGIVEKETAIALAGGLFVLVSTIWSILDKSYEISAVEGAIRHLISVISVYLWYIAPELAEQVMAVVTALLPFVLGQTDKIKVEEGVQG